MGKVDVNKNVKSGVNHGAESWEEALRDAEENLQKASRELADWKAVVAICRKNVAHGKPWPTQSANQKSEACHGV
jgi:hypothetical protein